jgi:hypothetical protein
MTSAPKNDTWVWVVVQGSEPRAQYVGQVDGDTGVAYIPAFFQKEDALMCLPRIAQQASGPCEVQAVCFGDLAQDAAQHGFMVFMLTSEGRICHTLPAGGA